MKELLQTLSWVFLIMFVVVLLNPQGTAKEVHEFWMILTTGTV